MEHERVTVLRLRQDENVFTFEPYRVCSCEVKVEDKKCIFSEVGIGARMVRIVLRHDARLSLHDRLSWRGQVLFLSSIVPLDRRYDQLICAMVTEQTVVSRQRRAAAPLTFPGVITEKYVRWDTPGEPLGLNETLYVLVTPKAVDLHPGSLVTILGASFEVRTRHALDEYKNEFEIERREDL